jgi:hypothetical protein
MKKKTVIGGVFAGLFLTTAVCAAADTDTWTIIKAPGEIVGRWKGGAESLIPAGALAPEAPAVVLDYIMIAAYEAGAENAVTELSIGVGGLLDALMKALPESAGPVTKEALWSQLVAELGAGSETVSAADYYIKYTLKQPVEEFIATDEDGQMFINQDGTKMKWVSFTPLTMGIGDTGFTEMIFTRQ